MAEKNTRSILETIKNKLNKFDQKSEKSEQISNIAAEFEYITPATETTQAEPKISIPETVEESENVEDKKELNFEDLGHEDEEEKSPQTEDEKENELEDLDFELEDSKPAEVAPEEKEDDFLENEAEPKIEETENHNPKPIDEDDAEKMLFAEDESKEIVPDIAAELTFDETPKAVEPETSSSDNDDLNFDDLNLDEEDEEISEVESVTKEEQKSEDDFDIDALEKELAQQDAKRKEVKIQNPIHDEIDLEFEKELMGLGSQDLAAEDSQIFAPQENQQNQISKIENRSESKILSDNTVMQATQSIKKLIDAKNVVAGISNFSQAPALNELAVQLMEPKMEKWLNENLAELVEKVVREEIKKIMPRE